jgi:hypothetical protein
VGGVSHPLVRGARHLTSSSEPSDLRGLFFPLVKSPIHAKSRRNCNCIFSLCNGNVFIKVGFVRNIFAIFALPVEPIAALPY